MLLELFRLALHARRARLRAFAPAPSRRRGPWSRRPARWWRGRGVPPRAPCCMPPPPAPREASRRRRRRPRARAKREPAPVPPAAYTSGARRAPSRAPVDWRTRSISSTAAIRRGAAWHETSPAQARMGGIRRRARARLEASSRLGLAACFTVRRCLLSGPAPTQAPRRAPRPLSARLQPWVCRPLAPAGDVRPVPLRAPPGRVAGRGRSRFSSAVSRPTRAIASSTSARVRSSWRLRVHRFAPDLGGCGLGVRRAARGRAHVSAHSRARPSAALAWASSPAARKRVARSRRVRALASASAVTAACGASPSICVTRPRRRRDRRLACADVVRGSPSRTAGGPRMSRKSARARGATPVPGGGSIPGSSMPRAGRRCQSRQRLGRPPRARALPADCDLGSRPESSPHGTRPRLVGRVLHEHRARGVDALDLRSQVRRRRHRARQEHPRDRVQRQHPWPAPLRRRGAPHGGRPLRAHRPRRGQRDRPGGPATASASRARSIYVTASPCWGCFRLIANAGISRIGFGEFYRDHAHLRGRDAARHRARRHVGAVQGRRRWRTPRLSVAVVQGGPSTEAEVSRASALGVAQGARGGGPQRRAPRARRVPGGVAAHGRLRRRLPRRPRGGGRGRLAPGSARGPRPAVRRLRASSRALWRCTSGWRASSSSARACRWPAGVDVASWRRAARLPSASGERSAQRLVVKPSSHGSAIGVVRLERGRVARGGRPRDRGRLGARRLRHRRALRARPRGHVRRPRGASARAARACRRRRSSRRTTPSIRTRPGTRRGAASTSAPRSYRAAVTTRVQEVAVAAHRALGCRDLSRVDFIVGDEADPDAVTLLEVNTLPGMTATSLYPEAAGGQRRLDGSPLRRLRRARARPRTGPAAASTPPRQGETDPKHILDSTDPGR